jgi:hypothetical protein
MRGRHAGWKDAAARQGSHPSRHRVNATALPASMFTKFPVDLLETSEAKK